jgi:hypothetical protein
MHINISSREKVLLSYRSTLAGSVFTIRSKNSFTSEITASDISTPKMLTLLYKFSEYLEECNSSIPLLFRNLLSRFKPWSENVEINQPCLNDLNLPAPVHPVLAYVIFFPVIKLSVN